MIRYQQAINKLGLDKTPINNVRTDRIPEWASTEDFLNLFLPYLTIIYDSREQDRWIKSVCDYLGINCELAVKNKKEHTENLKEGDITFRLTFGDVDFDFTNICAYERKGSPSEFYNNCLKDRRRVEAEFDKQKEKGYEKFVLMLEFGNCLSDLINYEFSFYDSKGDIQVKDCKKIMFSTVSSWLQPNKYSFELLQVETQLPKREKSAARFKLFLLMTTDMFYYFRQEIRLLAEEKNKEE